MWKTYSGIPGGVKVSICAVHCFLNSTSGVQWIMLSNTWVVTQHTSGGICSNAEISAQNRPFLPRDAMLA